MTGKLVLLGDFNIHMDVVDDIDMITFNDFLDSFNLENLVHFSHTSVDTNWTY